MHSLQENGIQDLPQGLLSAILTHLLHSSDKHCITTARLVCRTWADEIPKARTQHAHPLTRPRWSLPAASVCT